MNIKNNLIEYGKLNLQLDEVNQAIYKIINIYRADSEDVQLFSYFNFNKKLDWKHSLEEWGRSEKIGVHDLSYDLLKLIKQKKMIKQKICYRNRNIIKYAINLGE